MFIGKHSFNVLEMYCQWFKGAENFEHATMCMAFLNEKPPHLSHMYTQSAILKSSWITTSARRWQ